MPTYEYRCKGCGQHLEVVQAFTDDALTTCEACGGDLRKVFGNVGISFKGSGFYKTDSRGAASTSSKPDGSGATPDKSSTTSSSESPSSSESSSSAKPADKPASTSSTSSTSST